MAQCDGTVWGKALDPVWRFRTCLRCTQSNSISYFDFLAPCFPIFEESGVLNKMKNKEQIPDNFLINLYAYTLSYWDFSQTLSLYPSQDQDYA